MTYKRCRRYGLLLTKRIEFFSDPAFAFFPNENSVYGDFFTAFPCSNEIHMTSAVIDIVISRVPNNNLCLNVDCDFYSIKKDSLLGC